LGIEFFCSPSFLLPETAFMININIMIAYYYSLWESCKIIVFSLLSQRWDLNFR
jgi:hypothetical protein